MKDFIRVLYVHRQQGNTVGGGWRALCRMAASLRAHGVLPEFLFTFDVQESPDASGVRAHRLRLPPARKGKSLPLYPAALLRLTRFLKDLRPDIIHLNDLDDAIFFVVASRWAGGIPLVAHARSMMVPGKFRKLRAHRLDRLFCVSGAVRERAIRGGVPPERAVVVYDPPDPRWNEWPPEEDRGFWRERLGIPEGVPVIGTVGNISRVKGTDLLLEAMGRIVARFPDVRCVVVGSDDHGMRKDLAAFANRSGISRNVLFAGQVPDPRAAVSLMDVFVLPSRDEGYGLALLEAMSYARPVVAFEVGGVPEILAGADAGILAPPGDSAALGEAVAGLLSDPDRRARLGEAGRRRVAEAFGEERLGELRARYRELTETAPGRAGRKGSWISLRR